MHKSFRAVSCNQVFAHSVTANTYTLTGATDHQIVYLDSTKSLRTTGNLRLDNDGQLIIRAKDVTINGSLKVCGEALGDNTNNNGVLWDTGVYEKDYKILHTKRHSKTVVVKGHEPLTTQIEVLWPGVPKDEFSVVDITGMWKVGSDGVSSPIGEGPWKDDLVPEGYCYFDTPTYYSVGLGKDKQNAGFIINMCLPANPDKSVHITLLWETLHVEIVPCDPYVFV